MVEADVVTVSAASAGSKAVGATTYVWGRVAGHSSGRVFTQVLVAGEWRTSQVASSDATGHYQIPLTYGASTVGTYTYRVGAITPVGTAYSVEFTMRRTATVSAASAGSKAVGATTYAWGRVAGHSSGRVFTQVLVAGEWRTSQVVSSDATGHYQIPLTYGASTVGTYTYRVGAITPVGTAYSSTFTIKRTPLTPIPIYGRFCRNGAPIRSVSTTDKVIAFTFDDGPWPRNTEAVMTTFERYRWRANFFMIGANVLQYGEIARSVVQRGHGIAAHSVTHRYGVSTIAREASASADIIQSATGVKPTFFRSPGLTQSSTIDRAVYSAGMCNISTASDLGDWKSPRASSSTLCSRFQGALRPGAIILLHDGGSHSQTVNAVSCMLDSVRRNGYRVVDLGALLSRQY